jgi:hypothetical protein
LKPVPGIVEVIVDAVNDSMNIRGIRGGHLLNNPMGLAQATRSQEEQTPDAAGRRTGRRGNFFFLRRCNLLDQIQVGQRILSGNSRQMRRTKKIGDERGIIHSGISTKDGECIETGRSGTILSLRFQGAMIESSID